MTNHLILPSNTADFTANSTNSFRVKLPYVFSYDGSWELALTEITYPVSWNTVKVGEGRVQLSYKHNNLTIPIHVKVQPGFYNTIHELLRALAYALKATDEKLPNKLFMADFAIFKLAKLKKNDNKAFHDWEKLGHNYEDIFKKPELVPDSKGSIEGLEKLLNNMTRSDRARRKSNQNLMTNALKFVYNSDIKRVMVTLDEKTIKRIKFDPALQFMLGFGKERELKGKSLVADYNSDISAGLTNFFIYCNLVEPQCIGNSLKHLLRTVPLTESVLGNVVHKEFISPHYVGLLCKTFDTVEVEIRDDHGELIDFQFGKVILKLHFRKKSLLNL
jgi:hypothetical protein